MKVLYLNPDRGIPVLGDKGASVHVREFVTALAQEGHEVCLVCSSLGGGNASPPGAIVELPANASGPDLLAESIAQGLPPSSITDVILRRELGRLSYDRGFCARVTRSIDELGFRPDIIYERYALFHQEGAVLARMFDIPRLLEVNAPLIREQEQYRGLALKAVATAAEHASFHGADSIIAVSTEVAAYAASRGMRPEKILVVPNGVDTKRFCPGGGQAVRRDLGLGDGPVIGFIGSFKPWHGVGFLIDAFATMAPQHPSLRLLCVGEGPELEADRLWVAARGLENRVVFTGRVPHADIPAYLAAMDVSIAPYLPDRDFYFSPLKVVEALAVGTPVIATRVGQLEWLVEHGVTGFLFEPGDQADFIAKTSSLIGDPVRRIAMSAAARERALADFSWTVAASRVLDEGRRHIERRRAA